jgi:hypothetical protein
VTLHTALKLAFSNIASRVRSKFLELPRIMRRSPFISAFLSVAGLTVLSLPVCWPLLSVIAQPEVLLAVLIANLALTLIAARIVRKSIISRISELTRSQDDQRRSEARRQSMIKQQLEDFERRIVVLLRKQASESLPADDELAATHADRKAAEGDRAAGVAGDRA